MAGNASRTHLLRLLTKRSLASSAANPAVNPNTNIQLTTLPNKLVVASADSVIPGVVKISVAFRGGSRYESEENTGVSHVLRASCGLSTNSATQFAITRNLQMLGAGLSATGCRETIVYTLETTSEHLDKTLAFLKTVAVEQSFKPWELKDNIPRIQHELNALPPQAVLFDLAHSAAYRKGLGNSIFAKDYRLGKIGSETLQHFVNENFRSSRAAVAGVGISHSHLCDFANQLNLENGSGGAGAGAKYYGGEVRKETSGDSAYVMLAGESCSLQKKDVFTWGVLAKALGSQSCVKYGTGSSPLAKVATSVPTSSIVAVNVPHSDSGLLAIAISSHSRYSAQAVEGVAKALKGNLSDADIARGKALLKQEILCAGDCSDSLLAELAYQSLLVGSVSSPDQLAAAVDSVTPDQVKQCLSKFNSGKKSLAAVGNIHSTPYLDDLN